MYHKVRTASGQLPAGARHARCRHSWHLDHRQRTGFDPAACCPASQVYWMGLQSDRRSYPRFKWLDPLTPSLTLSTSYKHWGLMMPQNVYVPRAFNGLPRAALRIAWRPAAPVV
jgi:hypothetical protein